MIKPAICLEESFKFFKNEKKIIVLQIKFPGSVAVGKPDPLYYFQKRIIPEIARKLATTVCCVFRKLLIFQRNFFEGSVGVYHFEIAPGFLNDNVCRLSIAAKTRNNQDGKN